MLVLETLNLKKYSYSNLEVLGFGLKISRVHTHFDFYHTYNTGVPNLWYAYHWLYAEAFQVVREIFSKIAQRICFHVILTKTVLLYN